MCMRNGQTLAGDDGKRLLCARNGWEERLMAVEGRMQAWEAGVVRAVEKRMDYQSLASEEVGCVGYQGAWLSKQCLLF